MQKKFLIDYQNIKIIMINLIRSKFALMVSELNPKPFNPLNGKRAFLRYYSMTVVHLTVVDPH